MTNQPKKRGRPPKGSTSPTPNKNNTIVPYKEPRCKICNSVLRDRIDRLSAGGFGATAIADEIIGADPALSTNRETLRKNIERHVKEHLKIREKAIRRILENRAKESGILLENVEGQYTDDKSLLDILVRQATEQSTDPNFRVHMKDALEAIKIKKDMESSEFSEQIRVMEKQVWAITQAIKDIVPIEFFPEVTKRARELFEGEIIELPHLKEAEVHVVPKEELNAGSN